MSDLNGLIENAMNDPRFADILSSLKEKADKGELDLSSLASDAAKEGEKQINSEKSRGKTGMDSHRRLLSALKPYLGDGKKDAVENILRISEFSGVMDTLMKNKKGR